MVPVRSSSWPTSNQYAVFPSKSSLSTIESSSDEFLPSESVTWYAAPLPTTGRKIFAMLGFLKTFMPIWADAAQARARHTDTPNEKENRRFMERGLLWILLRQP